MRDAFAKAFEAQAREHAELRLVVADISPAGALLQFGREFPDRFINVGVAEQAMIGVCAGLALKNLRPFAYTIAVFALYRPFEMVRDDICLQNLPVTIVGMGAGVVYASLGSTHHAQEDIAIAAALPNMQVLSPCDPLEVECAVEWCARENQGPVYLRIGKAGERVLTRDAIDHFQFGKLRALQQGDDICVLTHGAISGMAGDVATGLRERGHSVSLLSAHTLKPLDKQGVIRALRSHRHVVVIEEHAPQGGLASMTKQLAWDCDAECRLGCFTLRDAFVPCYGSHADMLAAHGLSTRRILQMIEGGAGVESSSLVLARASA